MSCTLNASNFINTPLWKSIDVQKRCIEKKDASTYKTCTREGKMKEEKGEQTERVESDWFSHTSKALSPERRNERKEEERGEEIKGTLRSPLVTHIYFCPLSPFSSFHSFTLSRSTFIQIMFPKPPELFATWEEKIRHWIYRRKEDTKV